MSSVDSFAGNRWENGSPTVQQTAERRRDAPKSITLTAGPGREGLTGAPGGGGTGGKEARQGRGAVTHRSRACSKEGALPLGPILAV